MTDFVSYIDSHQQQFIDRLAEAVSIASVSGDPSYRPEVVKMGHWLEKQLIAVGAKTQLVPLGSQTLDGQTVDLPPAILGSLGDDASKKTILIYGHYDVQPALLSDGWNTEPFTLVQKGDILYGRGSTDDKGPILGWLNVFEAHKELGIELPVNIKFVFEGMEESGSEGLEELVIKEAKEGGFLHGVDAVCISDNYWLGTTTPCLTYGLRGLAYFGVKVSGPAADLHSGVFGGVVHEPLIDLTLLLSKLVDSSGRILIPGINERVAALTPEEKKRYDVIDITAEDIHASTGGDVNISNDKSTMLMARMRYPSLSLHGIEGAFSSTGAKTVIPATVIGKFSIRLVPDLHPGEVNKIVSDFLEAEFAKLNSKNKLTIEPHHGGDPWIADVNHWNYRSAARAIETVFGKKPDYTREGGSIPITLTFADALNANVLLLPMGRGDDGAHSINEKLDVSNFIQGSKALGLYLYEVAKGDE